MLKVILDYRPITTKHDRNDHIIIEIYEVNLTITISLLVTYQMTYRSRDLCETRYILQACLHIFEKS